MHFGACLQVVPVWNALGIYAESLCAHSDRLGGILHWNRQLQYGKGDFSIGTVIAGGLIMWRVHQPADSLTYFMHAPNICTNLSYFQYYVPQFRSSLICNANFLWWVRAKLGRPDMLPGIVTRISSVIEGMLRLKSICPREHSFAGVL